MTPIHFIPNEPQLLSLKDPSGTLDGFNVIYETSDGRLLSLPRPAAVKLGEVDPQPGEEISITKIQDGKAPAEWVVCLTARSEQERARREEREAEELALRTRRNLEGQLTDSLSLRRNVAKPNALLEVPRKGPQRAATPTGEEKGTGTYGPVPQVAHGRGKTQIDRIPFNLAFREVVSFVTKELDASGEQWSEQSRQDLVATVLIAGSKAGWIAPWERGEDAR